MNSTRALEIFSPYEAIIFDYGGIFIDIDYHATAVAFSKLAGGISTDQIFSQHVQSPIFNLLETGRITPLKFFDELRLLFQIPNVTDSELTQAWCAMLGEIKKERVDFLRELKKTKRIFMLSNINQIHQDFAQDYIAKTGYLKDFYSLFDHVYFSHQIGMRKPDPEIFEYVCKQSKLEYSKTIFIDDSIQHINSAKKIGLSTHHLVPANSFIFS
jgi:putative hydrolase of the HAD superfamily